MGLKLIFLLQTIKRFSHVKRSQIGAVSHKTIVQHTLGKEFNLKVGSFHCPSGGTFKESLKKTQKITFIKFAALIGQLARSSQTKAVSHDVKGFKC